MINIKFNLKKNNNKIKRLLKLQIQVIRKIFFNKEFYKNYSLVIINKTTEKKKKKDKKMTNSNHLDLKVNFQ